ncbi:MAG: hypothetical protein JMN27_18630 [gamma proteobacterium endosymbiont of Lamellibrachia anaximandri]|nr:hypothetical protein [gamma proteobacterium endosymbiont of Lamellibrachia anaximandri]MBL3535820.1 hypothetical protein [gamma proteobacterium endosymbiont of Lamellibrachia anaximandri]
MILTKEDIALIIKSNDKSPCEINFDPMRGCLIWTDEIIFGLSSEAHEYLQDFFRARNYLYHWPQTGLDQFDYLFTKSKAEKIWDELETTIPTWRGLHRKTLSESELKYFLSELGNPEPL